MNEKRFKCVSDYDWWGVIDTTGEIKGEYDNVCFSTDTVVDLLNSFDGTIKDLSDDYQQLMGENKELKKENGQLKYQNEMLSDELEQCKAVINKEWSKYLKKKEKEELEE